MTYRELFEYIRNEIREGRTNERKSSNAGIGNSWEGNEDRFGALASYSVSLTEFVDARITDSGMIAVWPKAGSPKDLGRPCILVVSHVVNGKEYNGYSYQCRPGNYDRNLTTKWNCPISMKRAKTGANDLYCRTNLKEAGHCTISYHIPTRLGGNERSSGNSPWIWYDDQGNIVKEDRLPDEPDLTWIVKSSRPSFHPKFKITKKFTGECSSHTEWYESIPTVMRQIKGMVGSKSMIKETMMLAAKAHKAALNFQKQVPSAEIHLLPMCNEQHALTDCRYVTRLTQVYKDATLSTHSLDYHPEDTTFSNTARNLHWLGDPVTDNGVLLPVIAMTWPCRDKEFAEYRRAKQCGVVMTIPPVGLANLGHDGSLFHLTTDKAVKKTEGIKERTNHYYKNIYQPGELTWITGSSSGDYTLPFEIVTPAATFNAVRQDYILDNDMASSLNDLLVEEKRKGSNAVDVSELYKMNNALFNFTNNQERVAIEYHHPAKEDNLDRFPRAAIPHEFLDGLAVEASLQSMPLC
jgi:hypothetical protein